VISHSARIIRLRRPPVFNVLPDPFVPEGVSLEEVDAAWATLCEGNPRYHDGAVLHVLGVVRNGHGGVTVHLAECSYRFHAVQALGIDTAVRPLGVKGVCRFEGHVLVGHRGAEVGSYPKNWEFVPGGSVEPPREGQSVDAAAAVLRELEEESGWVAVSPPVAVAMFLDEEAATWEIVYTFDVTPGEGGPLASPPGWEYSELRLVQPGKIPGPMSPAARMMDSMVSSLIPGAG
jgi:8-oxo-dGTP pyrophosphatase MutT (NUDIX family)